MIRILLKVKVMGSNPGYLLKFFLGYQRFWHLLTTLLVPLKHGDFLVIPMPLQNILREGLCLDSLQSYPVSFSSEMILLNVNPRN